MISQSLNGKWQFRQLPDNPWQLADVPGSVHLDLLRLGQIPDPFFGDQEKTVAWVAEQDWEYGLDFDCQPDLLENEHIFLNTGGLDTIAEVSLNDMLLGKTDNMFRSYSWEVASTLREKANHLSIIFRSPVRYITERYYGRPLICGMESIPGGTYLRKAACQFGWDWGPKLPSIGIWKDISLLGYRAARLEDVHLRQVHLDGCVEIEAGIQIERWAPSSLNARMEITSPSGKILAQTLPLAGDYTAIKIEIPEPEYWWPNGYGSQPLYSIRIALSDEESNLDEQTYKLGLRTIELRREPDEWGESFTFVVNGIPIFAKGSNWIPPDTFPNRITGTSLERLVTSAAAVHQNMLRVWGGGYYEVDRFYDLCDQYGILVWQDFMFACGIYPLEDPAFRENLVQETREVVRRLRHRTCLALWCGNNEMEAGWTEWGLSRPEMRRLKKAYRKYFYEELPRTVSQIDPDHAYWPSSPSSGKPFEAPNSQERGDAHYWDVWHGRKPFSAYMKQFPRFMSEFGFQSLPTLSTVKTFTDPGDRNLTSYVMEHHQRSGVGNELILSQLAAHFRVPMDFQALVYVSMLLQAEGIRHGVEHWRRNKNRVSGALYWQLDDNWPVVSWSSIDYYGRWKALHYFARRFFAPLLLSAEETDRRVKLYLTSDLPHPTSGTVTWVLERVDGQVIKHGEQSIQLAPLETRLAAVLDFSAEIDGKTARSTILSACFDVDGRTTSSLVLPFVLDKHLEMIDPRLEIKVEQVGTRYDFYVTAHSLARFVELSFEQVDTVFSDNYFDLQAGQTAMVSCILPEHWTIDQVNSAISVRSLFDSY